MSVDIAPFSADWNKISNKPDLALDSITISTTTPLAGGGDLSANRTLSLSIDSNDVGVDGSNQLYVKDGGIDHNSLTNTHNLTTNIDHDTLTNFTSTEHYIQTNITNVSSALSTGLLKATTGTGALSIITDSSTSWDTAYTHSQVAGGNSVHVSTDENTNWDAAYTHSGVVSGNPHSVTKSDVGLGSVENTALSTWVGTTNVTTLGTIVTGAWAGTAIPVNKGGTGQTSYTDGQLLIGNTTGSTLAVATLTAGANISITNGSGAITIASTAGGIADPGSSTDNALLRWNGTTGDAVQDSTIIVSDNGEMTNPSQSALLAIPSAALQDVTGDGTTYTVVFANEIFDQNADFNGVSTFTAPVTGRYQISTSLFASGISSSYQRLQLYIVTSNRTYTPVALNPYWAGDNNSQIGVTGSILCDLDANDTVQIQIWISGGTKTIDLSSSPPSYFSVVLVC